MKVEFLGNGTREDVEKRIQKVASAGRLSRTNGKAYEIYEKSGVFDYANYAKAVIKAKEKDEDPKTIDPDKYSPYQKNLRYAKSVIGMGHGSIAEHDYIMLSIDDVSVIIEHILIGSRLASFTIKSRREVDFRTNGFYIPDFRDHKGNIHPQNEVLKRMYMDHMNFLFTEYGKLVDKKIKLEEARYVLPYSFHSNIFMGMDARSFVKLTKYLLYGKVSNIEEAKQLGSKFLEIIDEKIPYMSDEVRKKSQDSKDNLSFLDEYHSTPNGLNNIKIHDRVTLTEFTKNADDIVLASALEQRYQISRQKALKLLEKCSEEDSKFKEKLMKAIFNNEESRELEQVTFNFDIPIPLAVRTHLERHRMQSLLTPDFVPLWDLKNYDVPLTLKKEEKAHYDFIFETNRKMREYFENQGVNEFDLVYFYQAANQCNVLTNVNGRALAWISRMRCCTKAQPSIRKVVNQMCSEVKKVAPLIGDGLGATCDVFGYCNEGKESCGKVLTKKMQKGNGDNNG